MACNGGGILSFGALLCVFVGGAFCGSGQVIGSSKDSGYGQGYVQPLLSGKFSDSIKSVEIEDECLASKYLAWKQVVNRSKFKCKNFWHDMHSSGLDSVGSGYGGGCRLASQRLKAAWVAQCANMDSLIVDSIFLGE